jgi:polyisoprenoid-binding protein YceI
MRKLLVFSMLFCAVFSLHAQKYFTKTANVSFNASSPLEPIEGTTRTATTVIDAATGNLEFAALVKSFLFPQALMQEHFNENYMESSKFPKATFKGKIDNIKEVNFAKDGSYKAKVSGILEMHGVSKPVNTTADIVVKGGKIKATTNFSITIADYNIAVPSAVKDKIAKVAKISVSTDYQKL